MDITNFDEARKQVHELTAGMNELLAFLDFADAAIGSVNSLKGKPTSGCSPVAERDAVVPTPPNRQHVDMPESMTDRVLEIFQKAGKPLTPKDAVALYLETGWPKEDNARKMYSKIMGGIAYLTNRKHTLERTDTGYKIKAI